MSHTNRRPKALNVKELQLFAAALIKYFGTQVLPLGGTNLTPQQFKDKLDAYVGLVATAAAGKTAWTSQLNAADTALAAFEPLTVSAHNYVLAVYGNSSAQLKEFGLTPRTKTGRTAAEQVAVNQKSEATRVARHTVSAKAKQAIHGTASAPQAPSVVKPGGDGTK